MQPSYALRGFLALLLWLLSGAATTAPVEYSFTIIQFNDVYEIFPVPTPVGKQTVPRGGLAYASTMITDLRRQGPSIVLHAGDMISPSLLSIKLKHKGSQMIAALNGLGLDLATFGNHEFDFGCKVIVERIRQSGFPWVSANVEFPPEAEFPEGKVMPYRVLEVAGLRVGIFGLSVPIQPIGGCGPTPITFRDPFSAAGDALARLKTENVDLIVALTHLRVADDRRLAAMYPEIRFIVGGHEHEVIKNAVGSTLITKAGANATALGLIDVRATRVGGRVKIEHRWRLAAVDPANTQADPKMDAVLKPYARELGPYQRIVGRAAVVLDIREATVREKESNFGNYIADVLRKAVDADVALINGGAFRDDRLIPVGKLTVGDLNTMLPFKNKIVLVKVIGRQLREALENGVSMAGQRAGRFPQVSGLGFSFNPNEPVGKRIVQVNIGGQPLQLDKSYTLATSDFLVERGEIDGYTMLPRQILRSVKNLTETVIKHIERDSPIKPRTENRIVRLPGGGQG